MARMTSRDMTANLPHPTSPSSGTHRVPDPSDVNPDWTAGAGPSMPPGGDAWRRGDIPPAPNYSGPGY